MARARAEIAPVHQLSAQMHQSCGQRFSQADPARLQEAALAAADSVDPLAARIGAVNTLVRQPDGSLRGYNTDCGAALDAVEVGLAGVSSRTAADDQVC